MKIKLVTVLALALLAHTSAHAVSDKYRQQLERSGCTQVTEAQGCNIHKSKAENAKAGFGRCASVGHPAAYRLELPLG